MLDPLRADLSRRKRKLDSLDVDPGMMQRAPDSTLPSEAPGAAPETVQPFSDPFPDAPRRPSWPALPGLPHPSMWSASLPNAVASSSRATLDISAGSPSPPLSKRSRRNTVCAPGTPRRTKSDNSGRHHRQRSSGLHTEFSLEYSREAFPGCPLPFDTSNPHIPSLNPPVNRKTLRELELDAILLNPQLRHDLLFDSGLQFRPTLGKHKHDSVEGYWSAVLRELESGCTCISFDYSNAPHPILCACAQFPMAPSTPLLAVSAHRRVMTVRTPSRIRGLLSELLTVLLAVIAPLPTGVYMQQSAAGADGQRRQEEQYASQSASLCAVLDPDLIAQEVAHRIFDPSGLFRVIGEILKCHCAPMRDSAVDAVVAAVAPCAPGGGGSHKDAVSALRMLFSVLEMMKLDIANHQLQTLRLHLIKTAPDFEIQELRKRLPKQDAFARTRLWLRGAYQRIEADDVLLLPSITTPFAQQSRETQIRLTTLRALAELVFDAAASPDAPEATLPETLHLDVSRMHALAVDAADLVALYMHLMLFRQLVGTATSAGPTAPAACASCGSRTAHTPVIEGADLARVKREVWELGPSKLGLCFWRAARPGDASRERERARWERKTRAVALQLAVRAADVRHRADACTCATSPAEPELALPSQATVTLAERWVASNLRPDAPLADLMRNRVRRAVVDVVVLASLDPAARAHAPGLPSIASTGLDPLSREIRHLAEKVRTLAFVHINIFGRLYEQPAFLDASSSS